MLMLALAPSTSSDFLPTLAHFDVKPFAKNNTKMLFSSCFSPMAPSASSAPSADDSGFFDDEFAPKTSIGIEIGRKLAVMCDDFDAELLSYSHRPSTASRSLIDRFLDFFAF